MFEEWECDAEGMMKRAMMCVVAGGLICSAGSVGQGKATELGGWRALSTTARSVTGDLMITGDKITMNFVRYPLAQIRGLEPAEAMAVFDAEAGSGTGNLYRVSIPGETKLLHKNTLCGGEETDWVVTYVSGKTLQVALFSGQKVPMLTAEALAGGSSLCGTFSYVR